jgi:hypothetical protein
MCTVIVNLLARGVCCNIISGEEFAGEKIMVALIY